MTSHEIGKVIDVIIDLKVAEKSHYHQAHLRSTLVYLIGIEQLLKDIEIDMLEVDIERNEQQ